MFNFLHKLRMTRPKDVFLFIQPQQVWMYSAQYPHGLMLQDHQLADLKGCTIKYVVIDSKRLDKIEDYPTLLRQSHIEALYKETGEPNAHNNNATIEKITLRVFQPGHLRTLLFQLNDPDLAQTICKIETSAKQSFKVIPFTHFFETHAHLKDQTCFHRHEIEDGVFRYSIANAVDSLHRAFSLDKDRHDAETKSTMSLWSSRGHSEEAVAYSSFGSQSHLCQGLWTGGRLEVQDFQRVHSRLRYCVASRSGSVTEPSLPSTLWTAQRLLGKGLVVASLASIFLLGKSTISLFEQQLDLERIAQIRAHFESPFQEMKVTDLRGLLESDPSVTFVRDLKRLEHVLGTQKIRELTWSPNRDVKLVSLGGQEVRSLVPVSLQKVQAPETLKAYKINMRDVQRAEGF